jgi:hypothetical protein
MSLARAEKGRQLSYLVDLLAALREQVQVHEGRCLVPSAAVRRGAEAKTPPLAARTPFEERGLVNV